MAFLPKQIGGKYHNPPKRRTQTTAERGYGSEWRRVRLIALGACDGLCGVCRAAFAVQVHHADHDTANNRPENLIPVCKPCHRAIHDRKRTVDPARTPDSHRQ